MATKVEYDWSKDKSKTTDKLRVTPLPEVPDGIVKRAQRSWDGDAEGKHVMVETFPTVEIAQEFHKLIRSAGHYTTPPTSVSAVIDPDKPAGEDTRDEKAQEMGARTVSWKAGKRRGRGASTETAEASGDAA